MKECIDFIDPTHELSVRKQADILEVNRSQVYYKAKGESEENLALMEKIDTLFLKDPTLGVLGMQDELLDHGMDYGPKRIRRLMRKMCIEPIFPKKKLTRLGEAKYIHPYLLRGLEINQPNQVWAIDITYIPMTKGFMYLTAIIDVYSRFIVGWSISNTMEKETQTELLESAIREYGSPQIVNSDQGSQYTCKHWVEFLKSRKIQISMDGKGRATDNAFIERWFRTLKQKHIYLNPANNGWELYEGVKAFVSRYNNRRHRGINRQKPIWLYNQAA